MPTIDRDDICLEAIITASRVEQYQTNTEQKIEP
jgi:hypothetical protein